MIDLKQGTDTDGVKDLAPPGSVWLWVVAAGAIGHALWLSDGTYDPAALHWVGVGLACAAAAVVLPDIGGAVGLCLAAFLWEINEFWNDSPLPEVAAPLGYYLAAAPAFLFAGVGAICWEKWARRVFIPILLGVHFSYGVWLLHRAGPPPIDVYVVTRDACRAMSRGVDPYSIDFPDIFTHSADWERRFYPAEFIGDGRIHFGYQYMPLSFVVAWAGHLMWDFRLGNLLAVTGAGALMAYCRKGTLAAGAACLWLAAPKGFYVIDRGWAEPVVVVCLALVVFVKLRRPAWTPFALGLLLASKQHLILAAPAALLLMPRPWSVKGAAAFWGKMVATGAAVTLPLVLWNFGAFWKSAVRVQLENPFREDSLNFAAWMVRDHRAPPPPWAAFALAAAAVCICLWKCPRTASGFAGAVAVIYLVFFALAKQAFCNYYFLIIGALCCSVAAAGNWEWKSRST